jgi:importin subunit beta-1
LAQWETQSLPQFMVALANELAGEGLNENSRQLAGLHLKNLLSGRNSDVAAEKKRRWYSIVDASSRLQIKTTTLSVLQSATPRAAHAGAQVVAKIGAIELQEKQWPELLGQLLKNMTTVDVVDSDLLKTSTLETLGYICEDLEEESVDQLETNQILTAIVDGMREDRIDAVRVAAARALLNSLVFTRHNFDNEAERTMIMQVICSATKSLNERLRVIAFESLARVASLYYEKLPQYIEALFTLTLTAIQQDKDEQVSMMAIEFWSTLCEEEIEIIEEIEENEQPHGETRECARYVHAAASHIVPVLLQSALIKQDEDADEDTWNISAAGAICLGLVAQAIGDVIVADVLAFVEANILHTEWRRREASIMAFGQILEGPKPNTLAGPVQTAMPVLVRALNDDHILVKDTTAWTLARICELHAQRIPHNYLRPLVERLSGALQDTSRVAAQACFAIHNLAQAFEHAPRHGETNALSPFFHPLLTQLLAATERRDWQDHNLRGQAYEAVNMLIQNHAPDTRPVVVQVMQVILQRLHGTFSMAIISQDDKEDRDQLQSLLCSVVQVITRGIDKDIAPFCDHIITLLLQVLNNQNAVASEEAFMAIGAVASTIDKAFDKYMHDFLPFLIKGLRNYADWQVCSAAVGTAGDICRALENEVLPYCDGIVHCLLEDLQNPALNRQVKPAVLSCFGDIALAIGGSFVKYLPSTLQMLEQAARTKVSDADDEIIEYMAMLREGILEAYIGVVQGLNDGSNYGMIHPQLGVIFQFLQVTSQENDDECITKNSIGLIGDLAVLLVNAGDVAPYFRQDFVNELIARGLRQDNIREIALWTQMKLDDLFRL